jgi:hypothetical protein
MGLDMARKTRGATFTGPGIMSKVSSISMRSLPWAILHQAAYIKLAFMRWAVAQLCLAQGGSSLFSFTQLPKKASVS